MYKPKGVFMYEPSGQIGSYKYYTLSDLNIMYNDAKHAEDSLYCLKVTGLLDTALMLKEYAEILADYENRYIDDGK